MASHRKKTTAIRNRKKKPHKQNLKANIKRIQENAQILRELASKDEA